MQRIIRIGCLGLVAGLLALGGCSTPPGAASPAPQARCSRACLTAVMSDYLLALQAGNAARLRTTAPVHFTETRPTRPSARRGSGRAMSNSPTTASTSSTYAPAWRPRW